MTLPITGAPEWGASQKNAYASVNKALRILDVFTVKTIVESRTETVPPGGCADGATYLVAANAQGLWYGEDGRLAIAVGTNASNGWHFSNIERNGAELYVVDEAIYIQYTGGQWITRADSITELSNLNDVDTAGVMDADVLRYDASQGVFYPATLPSFQSAPIKTIDTASSTLDPAFAGYYHRFVFNNTKTFTVDPEATTPLENAEWHGRNLENGTLTIVEGSGVTIHPPYLGTLAIPVGGTFTLKRVNPDEFDLIGVTIPA